MARDPLAPSPPGTAEKRARLFQRKPSKHASFAVVQPQINSKVTSAALRQVATDDRQIRSRRRRIAQQDRSWQTEAFDYAEKIGELGYLLNLQANVVALCDFPIRRWNEDTSDWEANDPDAEETESGDKKYDKRPETVMKAFIGPQGGRAELIRRGAYNLFCAGEAHLLGSEQPGGDTGILWEFLSVEELYPDADGQYIRRPSGASTEGQEPIPPDQSYVARCWRSSARFSDLAECEVRRVLPICKEIVRLTEMVDAVIASRIPAGMLFIPEEMTFPGENDADDVASSADDNDIDPFVEELFEHLNTSISDPGSGARLIPLIIRGPAEFGQHIRVIELARTIDTWAQELRQEALGRLAHGLDAPPEIIAGRANVNHWTSAIIDNDFVVKHIQPIGRLLADFLTVAYLRPMLQMFEDMTDEEAGRWRIDFDTAPVTARSDEAKSARDLANLLSDEAQLIANGFTPAEAVSETEKLERRLWQLVSNHPTLFAPLIPQITGMEEVDLSEVIELLKGAAEDAAAAEEAGADPTAPPDAPTSTDDLVDEQSGSEVPDRPEGLSLITERLAVAADEALKMALTRAGSKMISCAQGDDQLRDRIRVVRKDRVMSLVSDNDLQRFNLTRDKLLKGAWDDLNRSSKSWIRSWLEADGVDSYTADEQATFAAHRLCEQMAQIAEGGLLDDFRVGANGLRVPHSVVAEVLEETMLARSG